MIHVVSHKLLIFLFSYSHDIKSKDNSFTATQYRKIKLRRSEGRVIVLDMSVIMIVTIIITVTDLIKIKQTF